MLEVESLALRIGARTLCRSLTLTFARGELWAVLGANGSGKSTLLHTLVGLRTPSSGAVRFEGAPLASLARRSLAQRIGVLLQEEANGFWGTTLDYVLLGRFARTPWRASADSQREAARAALRALALDALESRSYATLSGGERQRARVAQLLLQDPEVFCLDEPLLHLDLKHQLMAMDLLRSLAHERNKLVLAVLHDTLWAARLCDRALLLYDDGQTRYGTTRELLTKNNLQALYGCPMDALGAALPA